MEAYALSVIWPVRDIEIGEIITRDYLPNVSVQDPSRSLRLLGFYAGREGREGKGEGGGRVKEGKKGMKERECGGKDCEEEVRHGSGEGVVDGIEGNLTPFTMRATITATTTAAETTTTTITTTAAAASTTTTAATTTAATTTTAAATAATTATTTATTTTTTATTTATTTRATTTTAAAATTFISPEACWQ